MNTSTTTCLGHNQVEITKTCTEKYIELQIFLPFPVMRNTSVKGRPTALRLCYRNFYLMMAETCCSRCIHSIQNAVFDLVIQTNVD